MLMLTKIIGLILRECKKENKVNKVNNDNLDNLTGKSRYSDLDIIKLTKNLWTKTTATEKKQLFTKAIDGKVTLEEVLELSSRKITPKKPLISRVLGIAIPIIIIALIAVGFYYGGRKKGTEIALSWVLWNGSLSALGSLIALAHPVTILVAFIAAPITSLCPLIGAGIVSALVQAFLQKPRVYDIESLRTDSKSIKGFYRNKLLKVLMVLILSSLGSSVGTFVSGADIITKIAGIFNK